MDARVREVWRYPVKSMLGERLEGAEIGEHGVTGDRSFALIDAETGKVCSAKRHDLWGKLFSFRTKLLPDGSVQITFPDGSERSSSDEGISEAISDVLGRRVHLASTAPEGATIEEIWDDAKGPRMYGRTVGSHEGDKVIDVLASFAAPGDFFDFAAIHLLTTNSLAELQRLEPESRFEVRRFRPNIVVEVTGESGFVENDWASVRIGDLELQTLMPVPRCVMTTLPQDDLPKDSNVLRSTARHNMIIADGLGEMPCAGIYCSVTRGASVSVGDALAVDVIPAGA